MRRTNHSISNSDKDLSSTGEEENRYGKKNRFSSAESSHLLKSSANEQNLQIHSAVTPSKKPSQQTSGLKLKNLNNILLQSMKNPNCNNSIYKNNTFVTLDDLSFFDLAKATKDLTCFNKIKANSIAIKTNNNLKERFCSYADFVFKLANHLLNDSNVINLFKNWIDSFPSSEKKLEALGYLTFNLGNISQFSDRHLTATNCTFILKQIEKIIITSDADKKNLAANSQDIQVAKDRIIYISKAITGLGNLTENEIIGKIYINIINSFLKALDNLPKDRQFIGVLICELGDLSEKNISPGLIDVQRINSLVDEFIKDCTVNPEDKYTTQQINMIITGISKLAKQMLIDKEINIEKIQYLLKLLISYYTNSPTITMEPDKQIATLICGLGKFTKAGYLIINDNKTIPFLVEKFINLEFIEAKFITMMLSGLGELAESNQLKTVVTDDILQSLMKKFFAGYEKSSSEISFHKQLSMVIGLTKLAESNKSDIKIDDNLLSLIDKTHTKLIDIQMTQAQKIADITKAFKTIGLLVPSQLQLKFLFPLCKTLLSYQCIPATNAGNIIHMLVIFREKHRHYLLDTLFQHCMNFLIKIPMNYLNYDLVQQLRSDIPLLAGTSWQEELRTAFNSGPSISMLHNKPIIQSSNLQGLKKETYRPKDQVILKPIVKNVSSATHTNPSLLSADTDKIKNNPDYSYNTQDVLDLLKVRIVRPLSRKKMVSLSSVVGTNSSVVNAVSSIINKINEPMTAIIIDNINSFWIGISLTIENNAINKITYYSSKKITNEDSDWIKSLKKSLVTKGLIDNNLDITITLCWWINEAKHSGPLMIENIYWDLVKPNQVNGLDTWPSLNEIREQHSSDLEKYNPNTLKRREALVKKSKSNDAKIEEEPNKQAPFLANDVTIIDNMNIDDNNTEVAATVNSIEPPPPLAEVCNSENKETSTNSLSQDQSILSNSSETEKQFSYSDNKYALFSPAISDSTSIVISADNNAIPEAGLTTPVSASLFTVPTVSTVPYAALIEQKIKFNPTITSNIAYKKYIVKDKESIKQLNVDHEGEFTYTFAAHKLPKNVNLSIAPVFVIGKQYGVFAETKITPKNSSGKNIELGYYFGRRLLGEQAEKIIENQKSGNQNGYLMEIHLLEPDDNGNELIVIDAEKERNFTAFINHSPTPNCVLRYVYDKKTFQLELSVMPIRKIYKGEQLTINYGALFFEDAFYLHKSDNWESYIERYQKNKNYYLSSLYSFTTKLQEDFGLPNDAKLLLPTIFVDIEKNSMEDIKKKIKDKNYPLDLPGYCAEETSILEPQFQQHFTPIMYACYKQKIAIVNALIDSNRVDVERLMLNSGCSSVMLLLLNPPQSSSEKRKIEELAIKLFKKMKQPFAVNAQGFNILHYAIKGNFNKLLEVILERAESTKYFPYDIITPLVRNEKSKELCDFDFCIRNNRLDTLKKLLKLVFSSETQLAGDVCSYINEGMFKLETLTKDQLESLKTLLLPYQNKFEKQTHLLQNIEMHILKTQESKNMLSL